MWHAEEEDAEELVFSDDEAEAAYLASQSGFRDNDLAFAQSLVDAPDAQQVGSLNSCSAAQPSAAQRSAFWQPAGCMCQPAARAGHA